MQCCWGLQLLLKHLAQWLLLLLLDRQFPLQTAHAQLLLRAVDGPCCCCRSLLPPLLLLLLLQAQGARMTAMFDQTAVDQAYHAGQQGQRKVPTHAAAAAYLTAAAAAAGPAAVAAAGTAPAASSLCYLTTLLHSNPLEP
jgi:hypothetical protein